jgi:prepilin-type N-terminal cleavage/methylation domain-containing protein
MVCKKQLTNHGFTIVELLVVIVVIGILAAITIVSYTGLSSKATVASLQSDLSSAKKQLGLYYVDHSAYPDSIDNSTNCPVLSGVTDNKYCLKPSTGNTFTYAPTSASNSQSFSLFASKNGTIYSISNNSSPISAYATGGIVTTDGSYRIHTFTTSGTLTVTTPVTADVLVVGGGGGGSSGGGGAGGFLSGTETLSGNMTVTVGIGGSGSNSGWNGAKGVSGLNSSFGARVASGGGGGGNDQQDGNSGASGGGGGISNVRTAIGGNATPSGQGNIGGSNGGKYSYPNPSGGGGGAGAAGSNSPANFTSGNGGAGINSSISGLITGYAGGGGGGTAGAGISGTATHGGGNGISNYSNGIDATPNSGGGGGGSGGATGGSGGSGIVIIRYLVP